MIHPLVAEEMTGRRGQQLLLHHLQRHVELMQIRQSSSAVLAPQEHRAAPEGITSLAHLWLCRTLLPAQLLFSEHTKTLYRQELSAPQCTHEKHVMEQ